MVRNFETVKFHGRKVNCLVRDIERISVWQMATSDDHVRTGAKIVRPQLFIKIRMAERSENTKIVALKIAF